MRFLQIIRILAIAFAIFGTSATRTTAAVPYAQTEEEGGSTVGARITYTFTILIGVFLALFLVGVARENNALKGQRGLKKKSDTDLDAELMREIQKLAGSSPEQGKTALAISSLVKKKLESATEEVQNKYTKIIEAKTQEFQMVEQKFERTLQEKKQTEAIVRSVAEGVVVVNNKGEVMLMNPAAEKLLNTEKEEKIGKSLLADVQEGQLFSMAKEDESGERDIELSSTTDEAKKILRSSSAVIEDENGKTVGMVTVLSDITKQKELEELKSNFVASVSHELRNPIGAIQQSISVILDKTAGPLTEYQERFLTNALKNLRRLSGLIDDLLDLAKFEAKKMELKYEQASINKIVTEVFETMSTWAKNKDITLLKNIQASLPEISLDPDRIIQVLINLISNAIKFTPNGGTITVAAEQKGELVELRVIDTGEGIDEKDLNKIFDKFQQVGKKSRGVTGTGLGLAIVKEIVHLHGGEITVTSKIGEGTTFHVTLPMRNKT